jgi:uncharacterized protein (TIGR03000 family)
MTNRKNALRLLILAALATTAITHTAEATGYRIEPDRALMEFRLPAAAALEIQGHRTNSTGPVRQIRSTPLEPGKRYVYDVRAIWTELGRTRNVTRKVRVIAGQHVVVNFQPDGLLPEERAVLDLTNAVRTQAGLPPLQPDLRLTQAAREHSADMARHNTIAHTLDNGTFVDRMRRTGYVHMAAGENCAQGQPTPAAAVQSWMQSPGHRANLLNPRYTEIGVGIQIGASGQKFWTQLFARPAGGGVVVAH